MRVYLSGPMGSGKTAVGQRVASRLKLPWLDLDAVIERREQRSVREIFSQHGEAAFRRMEADAVRALSDESCVVSLGGGTVTNDSLRRAMLEDGILITLTAAVETLVTRVAGSASRPLLDGDSREKLSEILRVRAGAYAEAHGVIDTTSADLDEVTQRVAAIVDERPIVVALGTRSYRVEVGCGIRARLGDRARAVGASRTVVLVGDGGSDRPWPTQAAQSLEAAGLRVVHVNLDGRESAKHIRTVEQIWDAALDAGLDRHGAVVGVGGGVIGDLTAFAASTTLRGVRLGQLPTTLLAMVDSSVGGKTGFNRAQGKNLVGTFFQPSFVLCDVDTLSTLPSDERISGLAEVVKSAWLDGEAAVQRLERDAARITKGDTEATVEAIRMSVQLKARIVAEDEHESGRRMWLNLGHTMGHCLEAADHYVGIRHGEAVALGMVAAMRVATRLGDARAEDSARLIRLIASLGLPTDLDAKLTPEAWSFLGADKKRAGSSIQFVVPGAPGATRIASVEQVAIREAVSRVANAH